MSVHVRETQSAHRVDWLPRSVLAGFSASVVMVITFFIAYAVSLGLQGLTLADRRGAQEFQGWLLALTHNSLIDTASASLYASGALHLAIGVVVALAYGAIAEPVLAGPGWVRGISFAMIPWLLSLTVAFPLVGAGWFGLGLGAGPLPAIGNLVLHLIYGATLGAIYGPLGDLPADSLSADGPRDDIRTTAALERAGAAGVLLGGGIGLVLGILAAALVNASANAGSAPTGVALVLGCAVLGAAFGAAVAPFLSGTTE